MTHHKLCLLFAFFILLFQYACKQKEGKKYKAANHQSYEIQTGLSYKPLTLIDSFNRLNISNYSLKQAKNLLLFIKDKDQEERKKFHILYLKEGWVGAGKKINFQKNDSACRYGFDKIIDKFGFPDNQRFGKEIDSVIFLILAHSPNEYRHKYIDNWEILINKKISNSQLFADIKDRTLISKNHCQIYGTQKIKRLGYDKDSVYLKICDLTKLNNRRKMVGLHKIDLKKIIQLEY